MALDKAGMFTLIGSQLPDNTSGAIQPATSGWAAAPSALLVISRLEAV